MGCTWDFCSVFRKKMFFVLLFHRHDGPLISLRLNVGDHLVMSQKIILSNKTATATTKPNFYFQQQHSTEEQF
jgi:hypothetical protein